VPDDPSQAPLTEEEIRASTVGELRPHAATSPTRRTRMPTFRISRPPATSSRSAPGWHEHRLLKGLETNVNLHVFSRGCAAVGRMLAFRDWLRTHDDDRELYESSKRELAAREWKYVQNDADAKSAVVQEIMARVLPLSRDAL
jgi:GrpB-like predicted nucleotidyltransferase (UPF0157 family)